MNHVSEQDSSLISSVSKKNIIIAFGGAVSSGKSSLLNRLIGEKILPVEIDATTSLPTYIMKYNYRSACIIRQANQIDNIDISEIKNIAHNGIIKSLKEIRFLFIGMDNFEYNKIIFLDTPGYSKHDMGTELQTSDEQLAKQSLDSADTVFWAVPSDSGGISDTDIKFLSSLRSDISKVIIITKADKKNQSDIYEISRQIKSTLDTRRLPIDGIIPISTRKTCPKTLKQIKAIILNSTNKNKKIIKKVYFEDLTPGDHLTYRYKDKFFHGIYIGSRKVVCHYKSIDKKNRKTFFSDVSVDNVFFFCRGENSHFNVVSHGNYCKDTAVQKAKSRVGTKSSSNGDAKDFISWCIHENYDKGYKIIDNPLIGNFKIPMRH